MLPFHSSFVSATLFGGPQLPGVQNLTKSHPFDIISFKDTSIFTPDTEQFLALPPHHQNVSFLCAILSQHYRANPTKLSIYGCVISRLLFNVTSFLGGACVSLRAGTSAILAKCSENIGSSRWFHVIAHWQLLLYLYKEPALEHTQRLILPLFYYGALGDLPPSHLP